MTTAEVLPFSQDVLTFLQINPQSPPSFLIGHQAGEGGAFLQEGALTPALGRLSREWTTQEKVKL